MILRFCKIGDSISLKKAIETNPQAFDGDNLLNYLIVARYQCTCWDLLVKSFNTTTGRTAIIKSAVYTGDPSTLTRVADVYINVEVNWGEVLVYATRLNLLSVVRVLCHEYVPDSQRERVEAFDVAINQDYTRMVLLFLEEDLMKNIPGALERGLRTSQAFGMKNITSIIKRHTK